MSIALLLGTAVAGEFTLDRLDIISEDPGTWINYELMSIRGYPTKGLVRWVTQVKPVLRTPMENLYIGISIRSQSIVYEMDITEKYPLSAAVGLQTQLLLPKGANAGLAWRLGNWRIAGGITAISEATWTRPAYASWIVLPTIGVGLGRTRR